MKTDREMLFEMLKRVKEMKQREKEKVSVSFETDGITYDSIEKLADIVDRPIGDVINKCLKSGLTDLLRTVMREMPPDLFSEIINDLHSPKSSIIQKETIYEDDTFKVDSFSVKACDIPGFCEKICDRVRCPNHPLNKEKETEKDIKEEPKPDRED